MPKVLARKSCVVASFALAQCLMCGGLLADDLPNPFAEVAAQEAKIDRQSFADWQRLMQTAKRLGLHGSARRYAREVVKLQPDNETARAVLNDKKFAAPATGNLIWLDWFDAAMWQTHHQVRDQTLGYYRQSDEKSIRDGLLRTGDQKLVAVAEIDRAHTQWTNLNEVDSHFFHIRSTVPLAAIWFVADELDRLALAYLDFFEIDLLPRQRFIVHLYRTHEDAVAANAAAELLDKYGAYYSPQQKIMHVQFAGLSGLTAVRHEMAHALNREFIAAPPQWFDEGVGVICQFAQPQTDGSLEFGHFPKHAFATKFIDELHNGARERILTVHTAGHVTTNSHYYSQFRSLVDFFMNAENKKYRMAFIDAMFRKQTGFERLAAIPQIDQQWMDYAKRQQVDANWSWRPFPAARTELIERVLKVGTSGTAFINASLRKN